MLKKFRQNFLKIVMNLKKNDCTLMVNCCLIGIIVYCHRLYGSYEALRGGSPHEAMEDFTGGLAEVFDLKEWPTNLLQIMVKSYQRSALMACSIDVRV